MRNYSATWFRWTMAYSLGALLSFWPQLLAAHCLPLIFNIISSRHNILFLFLFPTCYFPLLWIGSSFFPTLVSNSPSKIVSDMDLCTVNLKNTATFSLKQPISPSLPKTTRRFSSSHLFGAHLLRLLEIPLFRPSASRSFLVTAVAKKNRDNSPSPGTFFLPEFLISSSLIRIPSFFSHFPGITIFALLLCLGIGM